MSTKIHKMSKRGERTLVLIDPENLMGGTTYNSQQVCDTVLDVLYRGRVDTGAHVVLSASCGASALETKLGWPTGRLVWRAGQPAALSLTEVALDEEVDDRFTRVVIASGNGQFEMTARILRQRGLRVDVVTGTGSLSRRLQLAVANTNDPRGRAA